MIINFNQQLKDLEGVALVEKDAKGEDKPVLLKSLCVNALFAPKQDEKISGEEHLKRYQLAMKINNAKESIEVSAEEISLIKSKLVDSMGTFAVGQCYELLECCGGN